MSYTGYHSNSFKGLSTALSALQAQRARMDLSNQNIANANTEGYTRQRVELDALGPATISSMHGEPSRIGDGVQIHKITRMMDQFALNRLRRHEAVSHYNKTVGASLDEIELRFAEPSENGLAHIMGDFFAAWGDVANNPGQDAPRTALLEEARKTIAAFNDSDKGLAIQWEQTKERATAMIKDINEAAKGIAELNYEIFQAQIVNHPASEMQDERDLLITKLSQIADVEVTYAPNGHVNITMGSGGTAQNLVAGVEAGTVAYTAATPNDVRTVMGGTLVGITVDPPGPTAATAVTLPNGSLGGALVALNTKIPGILGQYDTVAQDLATKVNAIQIAGFQKDGATAGTNMFTDAAGNTGPGDITAATIQLNPNGGGATVAFDIAHIAASAVNGEPFNSDQANKVTLLSTAPDGPIAKWRGVVGDTGVEASAMRIRAKSTEVQRKDAEDILEASVGVDIDEEMSMLMATQRAYQAAARHMTAVDEALDVIINRMGRVGL